MSFEIGAGSCFYKSNDHRQIQKNLEDRLGVRIKRRRRVGIVIEEYNIRGFIFIII